MVKGGNAIVVRHDQLVAAIASLTVYRQRPCEALFQLVHELQAANAEADPTQVECDVLAAQQSLRAQDSSGS